MLKSNRYLQLAIVLMMLIGSFLDASAALTNAIAPGNELPDDVGAELPPGVGWNILPTNGINYVIDSITLSFVPDPSGYSFKNAVLMRRCGSANYHWLTSERLSPNPHRYGPWDKSPLSGCSGSYVIIDWNTVDNEIWKVCAGSSDSSVPSSQFYDHPNNRCYRVWRTSSGIGQKALFDIAGKVTNASGVALSGVTITLSNGKSTTTNSSGNYRFDNVDQGTYTVTPSKSGYVFNPASRSVTGPRQPLNTTPDVTGQNFTGTDRSTISGRVTDSGGGPLAGVTVSAGGNYVATTNSSGNYTLADLPSGAYTLTASKTGYSFSPAAREVTVPPNATGQNFVDMNRHAIFGKVTDGNGNALANVPIQCAGLTNSHNTQTDANGNYVFSGLKPGYYELSAPSGSPHPLSPTRRIVVLTVASSMEQNFTTTPVYGTLGGRITDKTTGNAIANARVSIAGKIVRTNSTGNYVINNVLPGNHTLRISADHYKNYQGTVNVLAHASTSRNVRLEPTRQDGYYLPYPGGKTYKCTQGNYSRFSHTSTANKFAFDFGTSYNTVVASRRGRVVAIENRRASSCYNNGCSTWCLRNGANYVKIRHSDGTESIYVHLSQVDVKKGQWVERGQSIGRSGNTGCSTSAHLHFVRRKGGTWVSVQTRFLDPNTQRHNGIPRVGGWYKSDNYRALATSFSASQLLSDTAQVWADVELRAMSPTTLTLDLWAASYFTDVVGVRLATTLEDLPNQSWLPYSETITETAYPWEFPIVYAQYQDANGDVSEVVSATMEAITYEPIQASFVVSPSVCVGSPLSLTNQSTPLCEQCGWLWNFGNGEIREGIEAQLDHQFSEYQGYGEAGDYTITLTASSLANTAVFTQAIQIHALPSAEFSIQRDGNTIIVQAEATAAQNWYWDFGDGTTASGSSLVTRTYTESNFLDEYLVPVELTVVSHNGCTNSASRYVPGNYGIKFNYLPLILRAVP